jgi:LmbE family N-acetylglucosaminyl deacetylase
MATVLAIHAHPDDVEHLCAGTLALLAAAGHSVKIVTVTAGECGSDETDLAGTARIRKAEAASAAALIGAAYACGDVPDLGVFNDDATRRRVTELVRWAAPDIVITASPVDYHPDHEAVSLLVRDACFASSVPNYRTGPSAPLAAIPHLYFMDPIGGRDREGVKVQAHFGVDVSSTFETKRRMLAVHESQAAWVARQHGVADHLASMAAWTAQRGADFGVGLAEGFRQYRNQPYPRSPKLQELIGSAVLAGAQAAS